MGGGGFLIGLLMIGATAGHAAEPAKDVIKIGMVNDQTGVNKGLGRGMKVGVEAYFKTVNERGGVNGRKLDLICLDDQTATDKTVDSLLKLVGEQKVFAVVGSVGSPNCVASLPIVQEYKIPFITPRSGASALRTPFIREVIHIRASYQQEIDRIVDLLVENGSKRISVFYDNDPLGTDILNSTEIALQRHGMPLASKGLFDKTAVPMISALANIMEGNPDAIIIGAAPAIGSDFIVLARKQKVKAQLAACSFAGGANLLKAAGPAAEGVIMTQVVPELDDLSLPITRECKEIIQKYPGDIGFDVVTLEGCMAAKSMVMALEKAGDPPTQAGFISAYESMKEADMGGIKLTFTPENHQGQQNVYLQIVQGGKLVPLKSVKATLAVSSQSQAH
jgi:branched-chain amino acid transport system substrate-binding protein